MQTIEEYHKKLVIQLKESNVSIENIARAWASIDGKVEGFDRGKENKSFEEENGYYTGYIAEAEELIIRAIKYSTNLTEAEND